MGDWLKRKAIGLALGVLGLGVWLGYHSLVGDSSSTPKELKKIPQTVFSGGGGDLTLAISMNKPGYLLASFSRGEGEKERIEAREDLKEGDHNFKIDLPQDLTYGYFELEIPEAPVGSHLSWTVEFEGKELLRQDEELREPLQANEAFFLQLEFSDLEELRSYADRKSDAE